MNGIHKSQRSPALSLGPVFCSVFINDLDKRIKCTLSKFAGNIKVGESVHLLEVRRALERALERARSTG